MTAEERGWTEPEDIFLIDGVYLHTKDDAINWKGVKEHVKRTNEIHELKRTEEWYAEERCMLRYEKLREIAKKTFPNPDEKKTDMQLLAEEFFDVMTKKFEAQRRACIEGVQRIQADTNKLNSDNLTHEDILELASDEDPHVKSKVFDILAAQESTTTEQQVELKPIKEELIISQDDTTLVPAQQQTATSPLLSSLLKSPTGSSVTSVCSSAGSVARATAPTITTLLTSGALPNQPAITLKTNIPANEAAFIIRPISGPPSGDANVANAAVKKSPSESAPTISMLLEKKKSTANVDSSKLAPTIETKEELQEKSDEPIEDDDGGTHEATPALSAIEVDATELADDHNDEEKLLEVFENIGSIEDIGIDIADVINDGDGDELLMEVESAVATPSAEHAVSRQPAEPVQAAKSEADDKSLMVPTVKQEIPSNDEYNDNTSLPEVSSSEVKAEDSPIAATDSAPSAVIIAVDSPVAVLGNQPGVPVITVDDETSVQSAASLKVAPKAIPENVRSSSDNSSDCILVVPSDEDTNSNILAIENEQLVPTTPAQAVVALDPDKINAKPTDSKMKTQDVKIDEVVKPKDDTPLNSAFEILRKPKKRTSSVRQQIDEESQEGGCGSSDDKIGHHSLRSTRHVAESEARASRNQLHRRARDSDTTASPSIEDDNSTTATTISEQSSKPIHYTLTSVTGSIPNSPASSEHIEERRETRGASKKILLNIYAHLYESKHAEIFRRPFGDTHVRASLCNKPMDLPTIKRNIENSVIRSVLELKRDMMLMCCNVMMIYRANHVNYKTAVAFQEEMKAVREFNTQSVVDKEYSCRSSSAQKPRANARKPHRYI